MTMAGANGSTLLPIVFIVDPDCCPRAFFIGKSPFGLVRKPLAHKPERRMHVVANGWEG
jgi:hypothetical protein